MGLLIMEVKIDKNKEKISIVFHMITFVKKLLFYDTARLFFFQARVIICVKIFLNKVILESVENLKTSLSLKVYLCQQDMFS